MGKEIRWKVIKMINRTRSKDENNINKKKKITCKDFDCWT